MRWEELRKIEKETDRIPEPGTVLAYTRRRIIFKPYATLGEVRQCLEGEQILELHLFNEYAEYRALSSRSPRYADRGGLIETIVDFPELPRKPGTEDVYSEKVLLERGGSSLTVLNHISYDERNGMAVVDNYRLKR